MSVFVRISVKATEWKLKTTPVSETTSDAGERARERVRKERERGGEGVSEQMASIELHQLERSFRNIQNLPKLSF